MADPHVDAMSVLFFPRFFRGALGVSAAVLFSGAALSADVKPPPQDQPAGSVPVDSKQVVCKRVRPNDRGMLAGPKVCHTRAEWAALEKQAADPATGESREGHN